MRRACEVAPWRGEPPQHTREAAPSAKASAVPLEIMASAAEEYALLLGTRPLADAAWPRHRAPGFRTCNKTPALSGQMWGWTWRLSTWGKDLRSGVGQLRAAAVHAGHRAVECGFRGPGREDATPSPPGLRPGETLVAGLDILSVLHKLIAQPFRQPLGLLGTLAWCGPKETRRVTAHNLPTGRPRSPCRCRRAGSEGNLGPR